METSNKSSSLSSSSSRCGSTRDASSPPQSSFPANSAQALFALKCRSGMTSITQEELERYPVLDTEDIVRQVIFHYYLSVLAIMHDMKPYFWKFWKFFKRIAGYLRILICIFIYRLKISSA